MSTTAPAPAHPALRVGATALLTVQVLAAVIHVVLQLTAGGPGSGDGALPALRWIALVGVALTVVVGGIALATHRVWGPLAVTASIASLAAGVIVSRLPDGGAVGIVLAIAAIGTLCVAFARRTPSSS